MSGPTSLGVVIVAWNSGTTLVECVRSLGRARSRGPVPSERVRLLVVDNGSDDFDGAAITDAWPDAIIVTNPVNRGFGPAVNQGVRAVDSDIVLLLNPDTRIEDDPFGPLLDRFIAEPTTVAVAPRLEDAVPATDREDQDVFQLRHLPHWGQACRELLMIDRAFPRNRWFVRDRYLDRDRTVAFEVEQPAAAALAVRRDVFLGIGGFDERFAPAWFEDVDLCERLRERGRIVYDPSVRLLHDGGESARRLGYDRFLPLFYRNACRYWRKHFGAAAELGYRGLVVAGMGLRMAALAVRPSVPRARREAMRAYVRTALVAGCGRSPERWLDAATWRSR